MNILQFFKFSGSCVIMQRGEEKMSFAADSPIYSWRFGSYFLVRCMFPFVAAKRKFNTEWHKIHLYYIVKGKVIQLQARCGPEGG